MSSIVPHEYTQVEYGEDVNQTWLILRVVTNPRLHFLAKTGMKRKEN